MFRSLSATRDSHVSIDAKLKQCNWQCLAIRLLSPEQLREMIEIVFQRPIALESSPVLKEITSQTFSSISPAFYVLGCCAEMNGTMKAFAVSWFPIRPGAPHRPTAFSLHLSHWNTKEICLISRNERSCRP
jgi:hypothetical protein